MVTRRSVLAATSIAVVSAGCSGAVANDENSTDGEGTDEPGSTSAMRLGEIHLQNTHHTDHEIQLAIEIDGDVVHLDTYRLPDEDGSRRVAGEWTETAASFRVHARLDDGDVQTIEVTDRAKDSTDCSSILIRIDTEGELGIWHGNCT